MARYPMPRPSPLLRVLFLTSATTPGQCWVEVTADHVVVHLGIAFRARLERASVVRAAYDDSHASGIGAHGLAGDWLVNTTYRNRVRLDLSPTQRGWVLGFPVRLEVLRISVEDREGFLADLGVP